MAIFDQGGVAEQVASSTPSYHFHDDKENKYNRLSALPNTGSQLFVQSGGSVVQVSWQEVHPLHVEHPGSDFVRGNRIVNRRNAPSIPVSQCPSVPVSQCPSMVLSPDEILWTKDSFGWNLPTDPHVPKHHYHVAPHCRRAPTRLITKWSTVPFKHTPTRCHSPDPAGLKPPSRRKAPRSGLPIGPRHGSHRNRRGPPPRGEHGRNEGRAEAVLPAAHASTVDRGQSRHGDSGGTRSKEHARSAWEKSADQGTDPMPSLTGSSQSCAH